jgi:putative membrane protein
MMGWYSGGMSLWAWVFMGTFWIALLALIVWLVVRLLPSANRSTGGGVESPEDILDRRFALGEIDEETYAAQRAALAARRVSGR